MSDLFSLGEGVRKVKSGELLPSEWCEICCNQIEKHDSVLKAFSYFDSADAIEEARKLDKINWSQAKLDPKLAGAPVGVKDIINTSNHPNSMGSPARKGYWPGNDARVVSSAKLRGANVLGKTTTAEFAVHWPPETLNPHEKRKIAGTSSTGSAVAVASGMVPAALGTQSAASIVRPASYNGVIGFKPSFGIVPRTGILKTCDSLDTVGWFTRCVEDSEILLSSLGVKGNNYPIVQKAVSLNEEEYAKKETLVVSSLRAPGYENCSSNIIGQIDELLMALSNKPNIEVNHLDVCQLLEDAHEIHDVIYSKSLSYYFQRELSDTKLISPVFSEIVEKSKQITNAQYFDALDKQAQLTAVFAEEFLKTDFMLLPTVADEAPLIGSSEPDDPSLIWTLLGIPVMTLPVLQGSSGYPAGLTVIGPKYSDYCLHDFSTKHLMSWQSKIIVPEETSKS